jgi:hypothetical protein
MATQMVVGIFQGFFKDPKVLGDEDRQIDSSAAQAECVAGVERRH